MKRLAGAAVAALALALPALAGAHVSLHPNEIPAGAFATVNVRVPGEEPGAYAYKVVMQLPLDFTEVDVENVPGWSAKETITRLRKPVQTPDGPVDEVVSQISWTGDRSKLGRLENGYFAQFPIEMAIPRNLAGRSLAFKTVESYSNGKSAYWIGSPSASYPAPTINITSPGGVIEDVAGDEAGPALGFVPAPVRPSRSSDTLDIVAVVLSALALLIAAASLRRRRARR